MTKKYNVNEITLDDETLRRIILDDEFKEFFINNFNKILNNTHCMTSTLLKEYCYVYQEIKEMVLKNFSEVLKKTEGREIAFRELVPEDEYKKRIQELFVENLTTFEVEYDQIILLIEKLKIIEKKEDLLDLLIKNIDNIIIDSGSYFPYVMNQIDRLSTGASDKQIKQIDEALVRNIDIIQNKEQSIDEKYYDFKWFDKMEKFKEEIKKIGPKFFINFPLDNEITEYKEICQELFNRYDSECFSILIFGKYDETKANIIKTIINELMEHSNGKINIDNIEPIGSGNFSKSFKIGDYILKVGKERGYNEIPNDPRILQPIIRRKFKKEKGDMKFDDEEYYFLEVQNLVDKDWWENLSRKQIYDVLFKIYCDMRDRGIVWLDIREKNVGRLLKPNKVNYTYIDVDKEEKDIRPTKEATGMTGELSKNQILPAGEYVILDTDFIVKYDEEMMSKRKWHRGRTQITYDFEVDYLRLKEEQNNKEHKENEYII